MLTREDGATYEELRRSFRWQIPERLNIGIDVADRHDPRAAAILVTDGRQVTRSVAFGELSEQSNRLANALAALGLRAGDRVAIVLPQRPETAVAHIAAYKLGAIAVPLSVLFGPDALEVRLRDSGAAVAIAEGESLERIRALGLDLTVIDADRELEPLLAAASPRFDAAATGPDTPALLVYTSGTTGPPKGALHGHRVLLGHLPGVELSHDFYPQAGDVLWTPSDWAWIGGLYNVLMPALYHGRPVVAYRDGPFDPERASELIERLGVRNTFMPATALRMLSAVPGPRIPVRTIASGGETLNEDLLEWGRERFGVTIAEFYGQTEANQIVTNCPSLWQPRPGWMGRATPGHDVRVIDGEVSVRADGDPVVMLGYWENPVATAEKIHDGWLRTGDLAEQDEGGSFRFLGRADDVITSAGYRIGPGEIETCLMRHDGVALAAAIGIPDEVRGQVVKAYVVPAEGARPSHDELRTFVRERLAPYEYPREIEFVDSLPMTTTGKIRRGELRRREAEARG